MHQHLKRALLTVALAVTAIGVAQAQPAPAPQPSQPAASPAPAPAATSKPSSTGTSSPVPGFTSSGYVRGYYFTRQNASSFPAAIGKINQATFEPAVSLHGAYTFAGSNVSVGATYLYADPMNNCGDPVSHVISGNPCYNKKAPGKTYPNFVGTNPDDTLPGFRLNALYEAYLQYKTPSFYAKAGDQVIATPWANAGGDSRIKPAAFEGIDVSGKLGTDWSLEGAYFDRYEGRAQSNFSQYTLLTATNIIDAAGSPANIGLPAYSSFTTHGFSYGRLGYGTRSLTANLHYYAFQDIANAVWLEARYAWQTSLKPFVAFQSGSEKSVGRELVGKVDSSIIGLQSGVSLGRNVDVSLGWDSIPDKMATLALPSKTSCTTTSGSQNQIKGVLPYFLPTGGTPQCVTNPDKTTTITYGGWASPYTDSYTSDPLFTTTIGTSMVNRRSPGDAVKLQGTFTTNDRRFRFITAHAWYTFGNGTTGTAPTTEQDFDATYYFRAVPKSGPYKGLSLRHRYAEYSIGNSQLYGGSPLFKYNRTQLQFDF